MRAGFTHTHIHPPSGTKQLCGAWKYLTKAQGVLSSLRPAGREHHLRHGAPQIGGLAPVWELTCAPLECSVPIQEADQLRDTHAGAGHCLNSARKPGGRELLSPCRFLPDGSLNETDQVRLSQCEGRTFYHTIQNPNLRGGPCDRCRTVAKSGVLAAPRGPRSAPGDPVAARYASVSNATIPAITMPSTKTIPTTKRPPRPGLCSGTGSCALDDSRSCCDRSQRR